MLISLQVVLFHCTSCFVSLFTMFCFIVQDVLLHCTRYCFIVQDVLFHCTRCIVSLYKKFCFNVQDVLLQCSKCLVTLYQTLYLFLHACSRCFEAVGYTR